MTEKEKQTLVDKMKRDAKIAEAKEQLFWSKEYPDFSKEEKINYWCKMFYWDFKSSYKENEIDYFNEDTLELMKSKDPRLDEILGDVIKWFSGYIGGDDSTINEIKKNLNIDG